VGIAFVADVNYTEVTKLKAEFVQNFSRLTLTKYFSSSILESFKNLLENGASLAIAN